MNEPLLTAAEVARLAGVGRAAVSNWRRRHPDFPSPASGTASSPKFRLSEIRRWLGDQGQDVQLAGRDRLWRTLQNADESTQIELLAGLAEHLTQPSGTPPEAFATALHELADVQPGELLEEVCEHFFAVQQRQHLNTPAGLAALMAELTGASDTVFDPACGPGGLLRAALTAGATEVAGQEIDPGLAALARARLRIRGTAQIHAGDSLRADAHTALRAEAVLCHPPFAQRDWGHQELAVDQRWEYGFPPKGESELAWLQHCLAHARPGGTVVLLLTAGVASRRSGRAIRQALIRKGALRAVVGLPGGALMTTNVPLHLWVLRAPEPDTEPGEVLLLDLDHDHHPARRGQVEWDAVREAVMRPWQTFTLGDPVADKPGRIRVVEPVELLDETVDLTPSARMPLPATPLDPATLNETRKELVNLLSNAGALLPPVAHGERGARPTTSVRDLARAGALSMQRATGRLELDEQGPGEPVLTGRDVATGREPTMRLADEPDEPPVRLQLGDVVVPLLTAGASRSVAQVITEEGLLLGPNLQLLRVDPQQLDPDFIAGTLAAAAGATGSSTVSGVHRADIRRVEIPVLDLTEQQALGDRFRRLREFRGRLAQATRLGEQLCDQLADGLATGTITRAAEHPLPES